jgi:hypothetical protein
MRKPNREASVRSRPIHNLYSSLSNLNRSTASCRYPPLNDGGVQTAKQLYRTGLSLRDVGLVLKVHASTVRSVLLRADVLLRDQRGKSRTKLAKPEGHLLAERVVVERGRTAS